ncbi:hypothetical protein AOLI_G00145460 [Acnodon oligacanthus]
MCLLISLHKAEWKLISAGRDTLIGVETEEKGICADKSVDNIWKKRTKRSSRRENELLCEIGHLEEKLEVENKFLEDRIKKHLQLESDRDLQRPAEAEREQEKLRATELEFLEREMMMNKVFAEREKAWERESEKDWNRPGYKMNDGRTG